MNMSLTPHLRRTSDPILTTSSRIRRRSGYRRRRLIGCGRRLMERLRRNHGRKRLRRRDRSVRLRDVRKRRLRYRRRKRLRRRRYRRIIYHRRLRLLCWRLRRFGRRLRYRLLLSLFTILARLRRQLVEVLSFGRRQLIAAHHHRLYGRLRNSPCIQSIERNHFFILSIR